MICPFIFLIIVKLLIKITMKFFQSNINFNVKTVSYPRHKVFCVFFIVRLYYCHVKDWEIIHFMS